jgi:hypothetical protein
MQRLEDRTLAVQSVVRHNTDRAARLTMMEDIQNLTDGNRLRWFGHVKRMDGHRIPKRLLEMKMTL